MKHASRCPLRHSVGPVFRPPKGKSRRTIPLPPELTPLPKAHREVQELERMVAGRRTTQRYTHVASPKAKNAAKQMSQALWGPPA